MSASFKEDLKKFVRSLGFDDVGIASVDGELPYASEVRKAYLEGRFGPIDYLGKTLNSRLFLRSAFPSAKTVLVVVKNYFTGDFPKEAEGRAKIARYAWGKDYHQWFKKRLRRIEPFLRDYSGQAVSVWPFNDTGPFLERSWAHKAGLGFIGKSAMFIHRSFGTWTLLGGCATDLYVEPDPPYFGPDCGSCTKCLEACPTGAIESPHSINANKCIATWTIERPLHQKAFTKAPRDHSWGFGCDICQEICPWNKFEKKTEEERFLPKVGRVFFSYETFTEDLRGSPLYRSKKAGLMANYLRIKHTLKDKSLKILLQDRKEDDRSSPS